MGVIVYTTPTCGFCHQVKAYLNQRGVPFTEHDVSRDPRAASEMVRLSGQQGVPVVVIGDQVVVGFNRPLIDQLLAQRQPAAGPPRLGVAIAEADRIALTRGLVLPEGAYVGRVHAGGAGERAGLQEGDVIVELAGQKVAGDWDVRRILDDLHPGQAVDMAIWRDGMTRRARVRF